MTEKFEKTMNKSERAVVLLSGGLDSATCLSTAKAKGYECYSLSIDYGQKHRAELNAAANIAKALQVKKHQVMPIDLSQIGGSALTDQNIEVPDFDAKQTAIPDTYVPARNTIFLSIALAYAEVVGANTLFIGVTAVDYSGYPDCRPEYIAAFEKMANLATKRGIEGNHLTIKTPLIELSKAAIIKLGHSLGFDYGLTVSCYRSDPQGRACGRCDSCHYRRQGFIEAGIKDPTYYQ